MATQNTNEISTNQEIQQSLVYLEQLKEQISALREQLEILDLAVKEHTQAIDTLKDFDKLKKDCELLIPIGADTLIFGKIIDKSKAIINVGAGIAIEDTVKNAIKKLTERANKIEINKKKILTTLNNIQDQAIRLSSQIEEKYQALQEVEMQAQGDNRNLRPPNVS